jgi:hypothetical protein
MKKNGGDSRRLSQASRKDSQANQTKTVRPTTAEYHKSTTIEV